MASLVEAGVPPALQEKPAARVLHHALGGRLLRLDDYRGDLSLTVAREAWVEAATLLRDHPELRFRLFLDLCGVDHLETLAAESPRLASRTVVITGRDLHREERIRIEACGASILLKPFRIGPLLDRLLHDRERPLRPVTGESWPAVREPPPGSDPDR